MLSQLFPHALVALITLAAVANGASKKTGSTVEVDNISYYVPPTSVSQLTLGPEQLKLVAAFGEDLMPLTVITTDLNTFDTDTLRSFVDGYAAADDVFSRGFLQGSFPSSLNWRL